MGENDNRDRDRDRDYRTILPKNIYTRQQGKNKHAITKYRAPNKLEGKNNNNNINNIIINNRGNNRKNATA